MLHARHVRLLSYHRFVRAYHDHLGRKDTMWFSFWREGELLGICRFHDLDWRNRSVWFSIGGAATLKEETVLLRALEAVRRLAFEHLGFHRVACELPELPEFDPVRASLRALGFELEVRSPEAAIWDGKPVTVETWGLVNEGAQEGA
jgi:RimJ/RimL family protein N-acetyltransferase